MSLVGVEGKVLLGEGEGLLARLLLVKDLATLCATQRLSAPYAPLVVCLPVLERSSRRW